jgi:hypothetical protein
MKRNLTLLATFIGLSFVAAEEPLLSVSGLDQAGNLAWTNRLCPNQPVYEVLTSGSPAGPWEHFAFVTNEHRIQIPAPASSAAPAAFFKIAWVDETPTEFDYVFDEGYGVPAVSGKLSVRLLSRAGFWRFDDLASVDGIHPTGTGQVRLILWDAQNGLRVWLTGPVEGAFLEGVLNRATKDGSCVYSSYSGTVYQDGFAGPSPIGTFNAMAPD